MAKESKITCPIVIIVIFGIWGWDMLVIDVVGRYRESVIFLEGFNSVIPPVGLYFWCHKYNKGEAVKQYKNEEYSENKRFKIFFYIQWISSYNDEVTIKVKIISILCMVEEIAVISSTINISIFFKVISFKKINHRFLIYNL
jgi:hypothetical protein